MLKAKTSKKVISFFLSIVLFFGVSLYAIPIDAHASTNLITNPGAESNTGWTAETWKVGFAGYNDDKTYIHYHLP